MAKSALPDEAAVAEISSAHFGDVPVSFVLLDLNSPAETGVRIDPDRALYPASMIKTPLAAAIYALADAGAIALSDAIEVTPENMTANDLDSPMVAGYRAKVSELVELMLTRSDNVATNVLLDAAGRERATAIVQSSLGLRRTAFHRKLSGSLPLIEDREWDGLHRNAHPAGDAARLFQSIALGRIAGSAQLYETLARQSWNDKLPRGLKPEDRFAHKTGDTDEVTHDGGILSTEQGGAYVLVVYTGMSSTPENNAKFGPFTARLRTLLR